MGIDGIGPKIVKFCAIALYKPIHHTFTLTLFQGYLPAEWCVHIITPIHKAGERSDIKNYRPISLLFIISKVLESIIHKHVYNFISSTMSHHQFGFLRKRSTLQQLLSFLNKIYESDFNSQTDVIYLDFRKAFDSVAHNELLLKLWNIGICGKLWKRFEAYLLCRQQRISINNSFSDHLPVVSGMPQGSILGPLLFLIIINNLPDLVSNAAVCLFAEDTKCHHRISNPYDVLLLQHDLTALTTGVINGYFVSTHPNVLY